MDMDQRQDNHVSTSDGQGSDKHDTQPLNQEDAPRKLDEKAPASGDKQEDNTVNNSLTNTNVLVTGGRDEAQLSDRQESMNDFDKEPLSQRSHASSPLEFTHDGGQKVMHQRSRNNSASSKQPRRAGQIRQRDLSQGGSSARNRDFNKQSESAPKGDKSGSALTPTSQRTRNEDKSKAPVTATISSRGSDQQVTRAAADEVQRDIQLARNESEKLSRSCSVEKEGMPVKDSFTAEKNQQADFTCEAPNRYTVADQATKDSSQRPASSTVNVGNLPSAKQSLFSKTVDAEDTFTQIQKQLLLEESQNADKLHEELLATRRSTQMHFQKLQDDIIKDYVQKDKPYSTSELKYDRPIDAQSQDSHGNEIDQIISSQSDVDDDKLVIDKQSSMKLQPEPHIAPQQPIQQQQQQHMSLGQQDFNPQQVPGMSVADIEARKLFNFITNEDSQGLLQHLKCYGYPINVMEMRDSLDFTLLTYAAYKNDANCFKIIFWYAWNNNVQIKDGDQYRPSECQQMQDWVNFKNKFDYTALHYVAQTGNYTMLTLLVEKAGADLNIRNKLGASVMHIAAQKDQPLSLYYFWKRGMDINIRDYKNCTPLHWACYMRCEMALTYLLTMKPNLEAKDSHGLTPLHIAVSQAERLGSTRNVRVLLLKGADRDATDLDGKKPVDWMQDETNDRMRQELTTFLGKQSYCECLMLRSPLVPLKKNHRTQALFLFLFLAIFFLNLLIVLPTLDFYNKDIQLISLISTVAVLVSFLYTSCKDPGVVRPEPGQSFLQLLRDVNPADLCPECKVIRTARSRHCPICNQCVERFDHHCPWVNNCVGIKNHNGFLVFLAAIWIKIVFHLIVDSMAFYDAFNKDKLECMTADCRDFCFGCRTKWVHQTASVTCIIICLFYLLLSTALLFTHIRNYMAYRTTNERFSNRGKAKKAVKSRDTPAVLKEGDEQTESMLDDDEDESNVSSVLTYSEIFNSSQVDEHGNPIRPRRKGRKGCCINCWKMSTHTRIIPQEKLYKYLADRSIEIEENELNFSQMQRVNILADNYEN